ncbi:MAG: TniB family NTP-binding protein, partial [Ruminococcus sp.]|nr:TniB family NTP-binding protein [Ruminococcus sp.]
MGTWFKETIYMLKSRIKSTWNKAKRFIVNIPIRFSNENIVISEDETTNYYHDLAPKDNQQSRTRTYHRALSWALENKNIYNIALSGPYGSGKSTIIRSYLNHHKEIKYINISLADFMSKIEDTSSDISEQELEIGILKQLFYHVSHKRIPQSRYRKLHKVGRIKQFFMVLFIATIVTGILCFNNKEAVINYINKLSNDWNNSILTVYIIISIVSLIVLLVINHWIFKLRNKINIKEINIDKAGAKNDPQDKESIFNKNLDEIIYFFEETNYKVVVIEDLDRFESSDIFVKLRELNTILNNYENIKRRIVFIYAIKDDMFKENDRAKFFDFIIPVIPIISATNSGDLLIARHKKDKYEDD